MRDDFPVRVRGRIPRFPAIDHLSGACRADIRRLEATRFWPGATGLSYSFWARLAHGPVKYLGAPETSTRCSVPECGCDPAFHRDHLEEVLHALRKKSARELRRLVWALDDTIVSRARVVRAGSRDTPWWRDQL